ncbi:MAG: YgcG family protein [Candidatus Woesearchaeota archaeon]
MKKFIFLIMFLILTSFVISMPVEDVKLTEFVNDYTNTLTSEEIGNLNVILSSLYNSNQAEVAIVIVDNFEGLTKEEYAMKIAHEKLGDTKEDNGLLILVGMEVREYRIEVGYGLEGILNDAKIGRFARDYMVPYFQQNEYGIGLIALSQAIHKEILPDKEIQGVSYVVKNNETDALISIFSYFIFIFIFLLIRGISAYRYAKENKGKKRDDNGAFTAAVIASMFLRGGGRGGSGGFGGFGGGGFGGGGAGGGW